MKKIHFITPTSEQYPALQELWQGSVRATHDFLTEEQIQSIRAELVTYLPQVELTAAVDKDDHIHGFIGMNGQRVEMLFVAADSRGQGIGSQLLTRAKQTAGHLQLDVNEQNPAALAFYQRQGFVICGRSETDSSGRPFPLLHMMLVE